MGFVKISKIKAAESVLLCCCFSNILFNIARGFCSALSMMIGSADDLKSLLIVVQGIFYRLDKQYHSLDLRNLHLYVSSILIENIYTLSR